MFACSFAAVWVALYIAHQVADHWVQTDGQAAAKGQPGWAGRAACAAHVASYAATGLTALVVTGWAVGLHLSADRIIAGLAVSAVTHYWADRRTTLARLAGITGHGEFLKLGQPRPGHDDNPTLGTGAHALDQSWHIGWLFVAALTITGGAA